MLILERKLDAGIVINGPCTIRVVEVRRGKVKLGIEARHDVGIWREELLEPVSERDIGGES